MSLTPETLPRHELIGLEVTVADAANADHVGISGRVYRETTNTVVVRNADDGEAQVPKQGTTFHFRLPEGTHVEIDGTRLVAQPARRTETRGASPWV